MLALLIRMSTSPVERAAYFVGDYPRARLIFRVVNNDVTSGSGEAKGDLPSDSSGTARDKCAQSDQ
jgi:hypothetical protein